MAASGSRRHGRCIYIQPLVCHNGFWLLDVHSVGSKQYLECTVLCEEIEP